MIIILCCLGSGTFVPGSEWSRVLWFFEYSVALFFCEESCQKMMPSYTPVCEENLDRCTALFYYGSFVAQVHKI